MEGDRLVPRPACSRRGVRRTVVPPIGEPHGTYRSGIPTAHGRRPFREHYPYVMEPSTTDHRAARRAAVVAAFDSWIGAAPPRRRRGGSPLTGGHDRFEPDCCSTARGVGARHLDGTISEAVWPQLTITRARTGGRDLLVLSGAEPDFRWREIAGAVSELALRLGVVEWVSLGSIPAAVPHTLPVPILATASKPGLLHDDEVQGPQGLLRVPSAALSAIELTVTGSGIPAVGFYAQIPHYVGGTFRPSLSSTRVGTWAWPHLLSFPTRRRPRRRASMPPSTPTRNLGPTSPASRPPRAIRAFHPATSWPRRSSDSSEARRATRVRARADGHPTPPRGTFGPATGPRVANVSSE
jgi:hypothetical protein